MRPLRHPLTCWSVLLTVVLLALTTSAPPASASWSGTWSGTGSASAVSLQPVGTVGAVCASGGSVTVSWAPVAPATTYSVWRSDNLGAWTMVSAPAATTTRTDSSSSLVSLSARWRVVAIRSAWTAPESPPSVSRVIALGICV